MLQLQRCMIASLGTCERQPLKDQRATLNEEVQSSSFSPTCYSMPFPEEGVRSLDKLLVAREVFDWIAAMRASFSAASFVV